MLEFVGIRDHRGPKVYMVIQERLDIREIKDLKGIKETEDKMAMMVVWAMMKPPGERLRYCSRTLVQLQLFWQT